MESNNYNPAIRVQGLTKSFGEQRVLDRVDLEVARGETLTVLGRSGTGKSVMLKLLIGLQKPDSGEIEIDGEEITTMPLDELNRIRKSMGFLFQNAALYDSLTVEENVAFPLRMRRLPERLSAHFAGAGPTSRQARLQLGTLG